VSGCDGAVVCAAGSCTPPTAQNLNVQPQNSTLLVGVNRISIALLNGQATPVTAANVSVNIVAANGTSLGTRPLEDIAPVYGGVPVYVGIASFPSAGQYDYLVKGTDSAGNPVIGNAFVTVVTKGSELAVGMTVPAVQQKVVTDAGVTL
jgi:hypothetical protein